METKSKAQSRGSGIARNAPLVAVLLVPAMAPAETAVRGTAELGVADVNVDNRNAKFGEYSGITDDSLYWIGNLNLGLRQDARYLDLGIKDLGLESRMVRIDGGEYGRYSLGFEHSELPHLLEVDARTPYDGIGTARLKLPADLVRASSTSDMGGLAENLKTIDLKTTRDTNRFVSSVNLSANWLASFSFQRIEKTGLDSLGSVAAQSGGRAAGVILPIPIDYRTDDTQARLSYDRDGRQLEFAYLISKFENNNEAVVWDVPFLKEPAPPTLFAYPTIARTGLDPDNRYQRLSLSGGMNFLQTARVSAVIEFGKMMQNEALLPYSTDDIGGTAAVREDTSVLPRRSAEAEVDVIHANLNLTANPLPRLGLAARYRFHQTDNRTPYTLFDRVVDDTAPQSFTKDIYSRPYDSRISTVDLSATYAFEDGLHLKTGYRRNITDYDPYHEVARTTEDTVSARIRKQFLDTISGSAGYSFANRDDDGYSAFRSYSTYFNPITCPNLVTVTDPDTGASRQIDTCFVNHPDVRKYSLASRKRRTADISVDYSPHQMVDLSLTYSKSRDNYDDSVKFDDTYFGLVGSEGRTITLDASVSPGPDWSIHAYASRERYGSEQNSRALIAAAASSIDASRNWRVKFGDQADTIGAGGQTRLLDDQLVLMLDYVYVREVTNIHFITGSSLTAEDMPQDLAKRQTLSVSGTYALREEIKVRLGVEYERYRTHNWSTDNLEAGGTAINEILPLWGPQPSYDAWVFSTSLIYAWR